MQKIVVIAGGNVARRFVERLKNVPNSSIFFDIALTQSLGSSFEYPKNSSVRVLDPTSEKRLKTLPFKEARVIFVILEDMEDAKIALEFARAENMSASIVALDRGRLDRELVDRLKIKTINAADILSNMLISFLPNTPTVAQNIGKGKGEIMEVMVPYGSRYAFRHVSNIEQKNWRIAAIYRNEQLVLPKPSTMIRPLDELIILGHSNILRDVYKSIKSEIGHFPQPFGANIYLFLDIVKISDVKLKRLVGDSLLLNKKLNNKKLIIKAYNINSYEAMEYLRGIRNHGAIVEFDFRSGNSASIIKNDVRRYNVGLILCDKDAFSKEVKQTIFEMGKPVLKLGKTRLFNDSFSAIVATNDLVIEKISYVFFDVSLQLKLPLKLYSYDPEETGNTETLEHYMSISDVYGVKLAVEKESKNFFREHKKLGNFIQFLPFTEKQLSLSLADFLNPSSSGLFALLKERHQFFIPIND